MTVKVMQEQEIQRDVVQVLFKYLSPDKIVRFWAAWQHGAGDYLALRRQLFDEETVKTLFDQIQAFQVESRNDE